ncbi:MAG: precorrin-2 C(20)-methyltransferase [Desulfuromonadales bacterium]|nr:precorrin-2 C(20)-methyltransferase [Desulfuromonadales bacterium]
MDIKKNQAGHFYAVGVGPGDPELLTLRAARLIKDADVIFAPQSKKSKNSLALQAIAPLLCDQEVIISQYPMVRDNSKTRERWGLLAEDVSDRCRRGQSVVQVTLGDPLIFATSSYLMEALAEQMPAEKLHVEPGISAFQMTASCFNEALTLQEDRLLLMSATDLQAVEKALGQCETLVLFKAAGDLPGLMALLDKHNLLPHARLVSAGGQGDHEIRVAELSSWPRQDLGYMTTMIVHIGKRSWREDVAC